MKKRIGNDITFTWHIYRKNGETQTPETFTGKEVEVKLISPLQRPVTIEDVTIATGVVTFTFRGKHQVTLGNYVAVLLENKGEDGMVTLDVVSAVTLVPHSYMEEDGDEGDIIEASSVELESSIIAGGIVQQQADWAQTDDTAVDYIKNKPNLENYARLNASNEHEQNTFDTYRQLYGGEQELRRTSIGGGGLLLRVGQSQPVWLEYEDVEKIKRTATSELDGLMSAEDKEKLDTLPTATELAQELADKQDTINDLAAIRSGASAGSTAVQPSDLTPIDNRLDNVEYCLGDYLKDTYVFNASNKPEVSSEPVYTDKTLYTVVNKGGSFKSLNCKLSSDSQAISALWIGRLYDNGKILFTQSGTATLYLVPYANLWSLGRMLLSVCDSNDNVVMNVHSSELTYNSSYVCTAFSCEVAEGYYIKMEYIDPNAYVWLGQIDLEINEVKQISTDVHANSDAIEVIEQKIPAQASSSNKLVDKNSLASVATTGSYNDLSDKPDLSSFITRSVEDLTNYYLKSETYTKTEVQQLIGAIQQFHYEIYPERPQSGAGNVLYLIGPTGSGSDKYEEYVYANNDFTKIGDTSIDLSGYVTTEALTTALADYVTSSALSTTLANYYNKTEVDGLFAGKEDVTNIVTPVNATDATLPITTLTCEVGKYYRIGVAVDTLAITLPAITDLTKVKTIVIYLTGGTTPAITISSSDSKDVYYQDGFEIEADNTYEINALFNGAAWIVAAVKINVE